MGSFPYAPLGVHSSSGDSSQFTASVRQLAPAWSPFHRLQLWPGACSYRASSPWAVTSFLSTSTVALWAPPQLHMEICSLWQLTGCFTIALPQLYHGHLLGCRKTTAQCLDHLLPSFCSDLDTCGVASLKFSLCSLPAVFLQHFSFFLKSAFPKAHPVLPIGSTSAGKMSVLEQWKGCILI